MMIEPPINELIDKADSRYSLVVAIAKRARQITDELAALNKPEKGIDSTKVNHVDSKKAVSIAIDELYADKIYCIRDGKPIKKIV